jgi:hypothetical protein
MRWDFKNITIKCHDYGYGCSTRLIYLIIYIYIYMFECFDAIYGKDHANEKSS